MTDVELTMISGEVNARASGVFDPCTHPALCIDYIAANVRPVS